MGWSSSSRSSPTARRGARPRPRPRGPSRNPGGAPGRGARLGAVRWLIVLPFARPGLMGMDFAGELQALGHEVRTFEYRKDNALYKNRGTQAAYQLWILRQLERACAAWRAAPV